MSDNGPKIAKLCQFKDIEDSILSGIVPLYLFILEQLRTEHFEKLNTLYNSLLLQINKTLKEVYTLFPQFEDLTDEEKIAFTEALSEKICEDNG